MFNKSAKFEKPRVKTLACRVYTKCGLTHSFIHGLTNYGEFEWCKPVLTYWNILTCSESPARLVSLG